jgi:hypothetical protein
VLENRKITTTDSLISEHIADPKQPRRPFLCSTGTEIFVLALSGAAAAGSGYSVVVCGDQKTFRWRLRELRWYGERCCRRLAWIVGPSGGGGGGRRSFVAVLTADVSMTHWMGLCKPWRRRRPWTSLSMLRASCSPVLSSVGESPVHLGSATVASSMSPLPEGVATEVYLGDVVAFGGYFRVSSPVLRVEEGACIGKSELLRQMIWLGNNDAGRAPLLHGLVLL